MKLRTLLLAAVTSLLCAGLLAGPAAAKPSKKAPPAGSLSTPVTGTASNGKAVTGTFTVKRFITRAGQSYALGTFAGKVGNRKIPARSVRMPVSMATPVGATAAAQCQILDLVLAPIDLNLLGLKVHLDRVHLNITAESGPGNLLGNLLCSITDLLNQSPVTGGPLSQILNVVLAILRQIGAPAV